MYSPLYWLLAVAVLSTADVNAQTDDLVCDPDVPIVIEPQPGTAVAYILRDLEQKALQGERSSFDVLCEIAQEDLDWPEGFGPRKLPYASSMGYVLYSRGDIAGAVKWWERRSDKNDPGGLHYLALLHFRGEGVTANPARAVELLRRAAEQGEVNSMHRLGIAYGEGEGVEQDDDAAAHWLLCAEAAGLDVEEDVWIYDIADDPSGRPCPVSG